MKSYLNIDTWNRKQHFEHFKTLKDPYFGLTANVDVTMAYKWSKKNKTSFFIVYLHACMKAINSIENLKYRIEDEKVVIHDVIDVSATILRPDKTFGFSYVPFDNNLEVFSENFLTEKERIFNSVDLFPPVYSEACIHCSAIPWVNFTGHKEPSSGIKNESVPKVAFGKIKNINEKKLMPVAINVNHALVDGYHLGEFYENFQSELNKIN